MKVWPQCGKLCWLGFLRLKDQCIKSNIHWNTESDGFLSYVERTWNEMPNFPVVFQQSPSSHCLDLLSEGPPGETCTWQDVCKALQPFNHTFTPFSGLYAHFSLNSGYIQVKLQNIGLLSKKEFEIVQLFRFLTKFIHLISGTMN